ncbi:MAG: Rdx family protein [Chloroflexota bacterium]|nr:Rdx family protein [Chloroflexota bacterium]
MQAAWIAAEMFAEAGNQVDITMTPAGGGTLEVILDGDKIYDRKAEDGKYPDLPRVKELKKALKEKLEAVPA